MTLRPITFLTAVAIAASCSMKEDRALCPCHLAVDLEEASDDAGVKLFLFAGTELISSAEVGPEDIRKPYEEDVPRQEICIAGLQGLASNVIEGRNVIIRTGSQADRIHLHSDYADCTGDRAFVRAGFHKNWASLEICAVNYGSDAGRMEFIVTGDASQVDLPRKSYSGFIRGINLLKAIKGVSVIRFSNEDIVRHPLVGKIVKAFDSATEEEGGE